MNITENEEKGKGSFISKLFIPVLIILLGVGAYGLGRLSKVAEIASPIEIQPATAVKSLPESDSEPDQPEIATTTPGQYVASKTGTVYYFPWCGGARRITEEKKIWFATKDAAVKAGYRPAKNCKGLE